ncbi:MAG: hypothetical protein QNJ55_06515 [Xenococcus sp. MO_188.B8]|nr:hypothetical protein [Xenococcus sp. MO_188.B8]
MKPLSIGIIMSSGYCIDPDLKEIHFTAQVMPCLQQDHLKKTYYLTFLVALWFWLPIYGWTKYSSIRTIISSLSLTNLTASSELSEEMPAYTKALTEAPTWRFVGAGFCFNVEILTAVLMIGLAIVPGATIIAKLSPAAGQDLSLVLILLLNLLNIATTILFLLLLKWLIFRLFITKFPLAIEENKYLLK